MRLLILDHCACLSIEYFVLDNPVLGCLMMLSLMLPSLVSMKRLCESKKNRGEEFCLEQFILWRLLLKDCVHLRAVGLMNLALKVRSRFEFQIGHSNKSTTLPTLVKKILKMYPIVLLTILGILLRDIKNHWSKLFLNGQFEIQILDGICWLYPCKWDKNACRLSALHVCNIMERVMIFKCIHRWIWSIDGDNFKLANTHVRSYKDSIFL